MVIGISGRLGSGKDTVGEIIQYLTGVDADGKFSKGLNWSHTSSFEIKKFAGMLKYFASRLTGVPVEYFEDQDFKKREMSEEWWYWSNTDKTTTKIPYTNETKILANSNSDIVLYKTTYREFLQVLGTEVMRDGLHTNVWVNALFADYKRKLELVKSDNPKYDLKAEEVGNYPNWIITDMRFPNEIAAVELREGITIRVNRDAAIKVQHSGKEDDFTIEKFDKNNPKHVALKAGEDKMLHPSETALDDAKFDYIIENDGTLDELVEKVREILIREKIIS